jgi:adenylate kinase
MASHVVLLGPPGAGKGTHAKILSDRYCLPHISTGDLLRSGIKKGTALGKRAQSFVENGKLVPDDLVIEIIAERFKESDVAEGFILDGFPRTVEQATELEKMLSEQKKDINFVFEFDTTEGKVVERLTGRRTCPNCSSNFHVRNIPPKKEGICDACGTALVQRKDDHLDTVRERLKVYEKQTAPLIDFYRVRKLLRTMDGDLEIEPLQVELAKHLQSK